MYLFSLWIMSDQVYLIWFHRNADRSRRVTEDNWILRITYPLFLLISMVCDVDHSLYLIVLGMFVLTIWGISLYKIITDGDFACRPDNLEYLRNIVYLSSSYATDAPYMSND